MIKHIVMWKFKEEANGASGAENLLEMKKKLEALPALVSVIKEFEVGIDFNRSARAYDLVLYSVFETKEDLEAYQIHPDHKLVVSFAQEVVAESKVVDYVI